MEISFQHFLNAVFGGLLSWPMLQPEFVDPVSHTSPVNSVPVVASNLSIKAFVFLCPSFSFNGFNLGPIESKHLIVPGIRFKIQNLT